MKQVRGSLEISLISPLEKRSDDIGSVGSHAPSLTLSRDVVNVVRTAMRFLRAVQRHSTVTTSSGSEIPFSETLRGAEKR